MKKKRTPKETGELAELAFLHKATEKGLIVSHPYGDSAPFDFITLGNGKMCRVQVKCAGTMDENGFFHMNLMKRNKEGWAPYNRKHIDFMAAFVLPKNTWYILPPRAFQKLRFIHLPNEKKRYSRWELELEEWKENWKLLFDPEAAGFTLHACGSPAGTNWM